MLQLVKLVRRHKSNVDIDVHVNGFVHDQMWSKAEPGNGLLMMIDEFSPYDSMKMKSEQMIRMVIRVEHPVQRSSNELE